MKTFIATISKEKLRRVGGCNVTAQIYRIKNNQPIHITDVEWSTSSFRGETSAVMNKLIEVKQIPKKYYGYYQESAGNFKIHMI